jgi:formylglycine-generating enzyme required for sulfatase activity
MTNTAAAVAVAVVLGSAGAARAVPEVSDVTMAQRENSRIVDIAYTLSWEPAIVTLGIETNGVPIPDAAVTRLSGDVSAVVQPGARLIVWNAGADWPEHNVTNARARVTAWSTNSPPRYMAIDLGKGTAASEGNPYPVYYYVSAEAVPEGVTNDLYKTTRLLMRKIPATGAGGFKMGSPVSEYARSDTRENWHDVILTDDYYVGVYEVTQSQWQQVMGTQPSAWSHSDHWLTRPVEQVSYYDIREKPAGSSSAITPNWPQSDEAGADSFIGRVRTRTGLTGFDLPTDAQWEYACRAGTTGALNDSTVNITDPNSDARLDALGRYERNSGRILVGSTWADPDAALGVSKSAITTDYATAKVGTYQPNTWGLYDMHGNVAEWCLDWFVESLGTDVVTNPTGPLSGPSRVRRIGSWNGVASYCRSASRSHGSPSDRWSNIGFRPVMVLP